ncbi:MAG: hypothetical protein WDM87_12865 [Terracidiphilus sp.]
MKRNIFVYHIVGGDGGSIGCAAGEPAECILGTSNPPPDDTITTPEPQPAPVAKPSPSHPAYAQPAAPQQAQNAQPAQRSLDGSLYTIPANAADGTDDGIVQVAPDASAPPALNSRLAQNNSASSDPDGDIVHVAPLPPGTLGEGAVIRVRLIDRLSTAMNQSGDAFRTRVVSDVLQDGQVLIPAGSEIDGKVDSVSSGHFAGHGSMRPAAGICNSR